MEQLQLLPFCSIDSQNKKRVSMFDLEQTKLNTYTQEKINNKISQITLLKQENIPTRRSQ